MNDLLIVEIALSCTKIIIFLHFMQKFNMAAKKWRENDFWQNIADDSVYILRVKNFIEMAVSRTVAKIIVFLHFTQKFNMAVKNGGKSIFDKKVQITQNIPQVKNFIKTTLSRTICKINVFFCIFHHCKIQKIAITHLAIEVHL